MANANQNGTSAWQLVLAWGFVGIPLTLGVILTQVAEAVASLPRLVATAGSMRSDPATRRTVSSRRTLVLEFDAADRARADLRLALPRRAPPLIANFAGAPRRAVAQPGPPKETFAAMSAAFLAPV